MTNSNQKSSYSQSGEDLIIKFIFDALGINKPSYIDIGAYHPEILSNTALFYQNGSRGLNIEANPQLITNFIDLRNEDINLNIGIGETTEKLDFYVISVPTLSTFSETEAKLYTENEKYKIEETIPIETYTVNHVINHYLDGHFPDFLSLDVEGFDLLILRSIDYEKSYPLVICVETISFSETGEGIKNLEIINFLESKGYLKYADTYINTIFVKANVWLNQKITNYDFDQKNKIITHAISHQVDHNLIYQLELAKQQITAMESSKFWKLRKIWFKLKSFLKSDHNQEQDSFVKIESQASSKLEEVNLEQVNLIPVQVGTINEQPRNQWIEKQLGQIPAGLRLLDAGCGEQQYRKFCQHLTYVGQDFDSYHGEGDLKGLQMGSWDQSNIDIISDITLIPQPDQSFDVILCSEVFEHLPDPLSALKEFERLLIPGGKLILTAPFCSLTHFSPYHFYSGFNRYFYETNLSKYGFEILEIDINGNFFEYVAQELRRVNYVGQRYANYDFSDQDHSTIYQSLCLLDTINQQQKDSEELLCFGYHILAVKK